MAIVRLDFEKITNLESFHLVCKNAFGFPEFYGMIMNAWIDCLTYLREDDGMSKFVLKETEHLIIEIPLTRLVISHLPEIMNTLMASAMIFHRSMM